MASLRNLPYRIVCAIGLNDGAFPLPQRPGEFDLMAREPRRGDRQRRTDERNVFLDLLVAARERLYLSYTGKSVRDNSPLPPSVLVAELVDYCAAAIDEMPFSPDSLQAARKRLTVEHPLQSFSIEYFEPDADPRRRSCNDEYCAALKQRLAATSAPPVLEPPATTADESGDEGEPPAEDEDENEAAEPQQGFFMLPLAKAGPEFHEVTLSNLARFFRNPCRVSASCSPKATRNCRTTSPSFPIGLPATRSRNACCHACSEAKASPSCAPARVPESSIRQGAWAISNWSTSCSALMASRACWRRCSRNRRSIPSARRSNSCSTANRGV
jgi:hypothetical protein